MTKPVVPSIRKVEAKRAKLKEALKFIYNKEDHTVFARTAKSWGYITLYYIVFYSVVCCLFAIMLSVFVFGVLSKSQPYRSGAHSIISLSAGTNVYPRLSVASALIILSTNISDTFYKNYKQAMTTIFDLSFNTNSSNSVNCPTDGDQPYDLSKFCRFTKDILGPCSDPFGQMNIGNICLYIRVNKVYGWLPKPTNVNVTTNILVNCTGQNPADVFALGQPVYYPSFRLGSATFGLIGSKFFPYTNQTGYVSPMAAVQFPNMKPNVAILAKCQVANLDNTFLQVLFEIMVYDKKV